MHTILKQKKNPWPFIALSVKMHMIFPSRRHEINEFQAIHRFIIVLHTIRNKLTAVSTGITIKSKGITLTNTGLVRHYEILMCGAATSDNRELWVVYVYLYGFYYKLRWRCPASLRIEEKKKLWFYTMSCFISKYPDFTLNFKLELVMYWQTHGLSIPVVYRMYADDFRQIQTDIATFSVYFSLAVDPFRHCSVFFFLFFFANGNIAHHLWSEVGDAICKL